MMLYLLLRDEVIYIKYKVKCFVYVTDLYFVIKCKTMENYHKSF